jgi:hypothetical protein
MPATWVIEEVLSIRNNPDPASEPAFKNTEGIEQQQPEA